MTLALAASAASALAIRRQQTSSSCSTSSPIRLSSLYACRGVQPRFVSLSAPAQRRRGWRPPRAPRVTRSVLSEPPASPDVSEAPALGKQKFNWYTQWYPTSVLKFTDAKRPHAFTLLGRDLVLWNDGQRWRAFEDKCPHRLAPLSEGRVESDGTLLCAYHGWRFDGAGACTRIPQIPADQEPRLRASPRACAVAYPTREAHGLLWVFASPDDAAAEAAPLPLVPELHPESLASGATSAPAGWNFRDLPYGWECFFENVTDPAHVPVSHHKVYGNRYTGPKPFTIAFEEPPHDGGFKTRIDGAYPAEIENVSHEDGSKLLFVLYCTPTTPGRCRHIGCNVLVKGHSGRGFGRATTWFGFAKSIPPWLLHPLASLFLHQDLLFLHSQQTNLDRARRTGSRHPWHDAVFTPGVTDRAVTAFRQWLQAHGTEGRVSWAPECDPAMPPIERDRSRLFDVWSSHTKNCTACLAAVRRLTLAHAALRLAAGAAALAGLGVAAAAAAASSAAAAAAAGGGGIAAATAGTAAALPSALFTTAPLASFAVALLLLAASAAVQRLLGLYRVYEFNHQDNN